MAAYERGDYATAMRGFRILVEQGDANAQFNLGSMYDFGEGVPSARESNRDTGRALLTQDLTQVLEDPDNLRNNLDLHFISQFSRRLFNFA